MYVEHLWHSLKQEEVYWHAYEMVAEAEKRMTTCATSMKNAHTRNLTNDSPTTYSSNENRSPKRHDPTRQYT